MQKCKKTGRQARIRSAFRKANINHLIAAHDHRLTDIVTVDIMRAEQRDRLDFARLFSNIQEDLL